MSLPELPETRCWGQTCAGSTPPSPPAPTDYSPPRLSKWLSPMNQGSTSHRPVRTVEYTDSKLHESTEILKSKVNEWRNTDYRLVLLGGVMKSVLQSLQSNFSLTLQSTCCMILCSTTSDMIWRWMVPAIMLAECLQKWGSLYDKTPSIFSIWKFNTRKSIF